MCGKNIIHNSNYPIIILLEYLENTQQIIVTQDLIHMD
jgi:hypothetical protein